MKNLIQPNPILAPFASSSTALKNSIPTLPTGSFNASLAEGFPEITMKSKELGGIPPDGRDFNGILNLISSSLFAYQNGSLPSFNQELSVSIGGYPKGAVLFYIKDIQIIPLISLIENNTYNFNQNQDYIGKYWQNALFQTFLPIENLGEKQGAFEINLKNFPIKKLSLTNDADISLVAENIENNSSFTFELHINTENKKPFINWSANKPLKWLISSPNQIEYLNLTNIFIFRVETNQIIASFGGAY